MAYYLGTVTIYASLRTQIAIRTILALGCRRCALRLAGKEGIPPMRDGMGMAEILEVP
jgi:hypothetical protein